jgi:hypothetical protein
VFGDGHAFVLLTIGIAAVFAGICAGGVKLAGVELPAVTTSRQRTALIVLGAILIVASLVVFAVRPGNGSSSPGGSPNGTVEILTFTPPGLDARATARVHVFGAQDAHVQGTHVHLVWTLMDAETSHAVPGVAPQRSDIVATNDDYSREYTATLPAPSTTDAVFLHVVLLDAAGNTLDSDDCDALRIGGAGP